MLDAAFCLWHNQCIGLDGNEYALNPLSEFGLGCEPDVVTMRKILPELLTEKDIGCLE